MYVDSPLVFYLAHTFAPGESRPCCAWQKGLWPCPRRPALWVYFHAFLYSKPHLTPPPSGMRGLPALIWDGSVLDAGNCRVYRLLRPHRSRLFQRRVSVSVARPFPNARSSSRKPPAVPNLFLKVSSGFLSLERCQRKSKSRLYLLTGPPGPPSLNLWKKSSTDAHLPFIL